MKVTDVNLYLHGSEDSIDSDYYGVVPQPLSKQTIQQLEAEFQSLGKDVNFICVENNKVVWCNKGTLDEIHNGFFHTYALHKQEHPCPIFEPVPRFVALKAIRAIRGFLSYLSKTEHRDKVKAALKSNDLNAKLGFLENITLDASMDIVGSKNLYHMTNVDVWKFFAFQVSQALGLFKGVEIYTKNQACNAFPELKNFIQRNTLGHSDFLSLNETLKTFYSEVRQKFIPVQYHHGVYAISCIPDKTVYEVVDIVREKVLPPVVVFDLDGTLFDERHRSHLRENKEYKKYFELCEFDEPIKQAVDILQDYKNKGFEIWILTGRSQICEEQTRKSLEKHNIPYDFLRMRKMGVTLPDYVLKPTWLGKYIGKQRIRHIYDDSAEVCQGYLAKDVPVTQVKFY